MPSEYEETPNLSRLRRRFREYVPTDPTRGVMLTETGIVAPERGAKLLPVRGRHEGDSEFMSSVRKINPDLSVEYDEFRIQDMNKVNTP